jgi:thiol-disulfide isomerase/thioredoxin
MGDEGPPPLWRWPGFCAQFADPYLEGTDMEGGRVQTSLRLVDEMLSRLVDGNSPNKALLTLWSEARGGTINYVREKIGPCMELAMAQQKIEEPAQLGQFVNFVMGKILGVEEGDMLLLPGGWFDGSSTNAYVLHVLERTSVDTFSLVTCNPGDVVERPGVGRRENVGIAHHPSFVGHAPKMKYQTCLRLDNIPQDRIADPAFLAMLFNLRKETGDESHMAQILYDVLLPWLVGKPLMLALQQQDPDPCAEFRTIQRSKSSGYFCVIEAVRYVLRRRGISRPMLKQLTYALRREMLTKVKDDLEAISDPTARWRNILDLITGCQLVDKDGQTVDGGAALRGKTVALYFSAHWCPPCRGFTPTLAQTYARLKGQGRDFEVVFVSSDKDQAGFDEYLGAMPWLALPFAQRATKNSLSEMLGVKGIPTLVLFSPDGNIVTKEGRQVIMQDQQGLRFPWVAEEPAEDEGGRNNRPQRLRASDVQLIHIACQQTALAAVKENEAGRMPLAGLAEVKEEIEDVEAKVWALPVDGLDLGGLPPAVEVSTRCLKVAFPDATLLDGKDEGRYRGDLIDAPTPDIVDMLQLPERVANVAEVLAALQACDQICFQLLQRADMPDATASAQLIMEFHVIKVIGQLFTEVIPLPDAAGGFWAERVAQELQLDILKAITKLVYLYTNMWQDMDAPSRIYQSERAVVAACMLADFDACIRSEATDNQLLVSRLLLEDGGYSISMHLGKALGKHTLDEASRSWQLLNPQHAAARAKATAYLMTMRDANARSLMNLRMYPATAELEVEKQEPTMRFVRALVDRSGYELMPRSAPPGLTEMHCLMAWFGDNGDDEESPYAQLPIDHPEWLCLRDIVILWKYLSTMLTDTQEQQVQAENISTEAYQISTDSGNQRDSRQNRNATELKIGLLLVRGPSKDVANFDVRGFGRKLRWGDEAHSEGILPPSSPANVERLVKVQMPTEDDILHADDKNLENFGGTLSPEEAERLFSYLTVEYVRLPLVLNFFCDGDRATYLFNESIQAMFRAVRMRSGRIAALHHRSATF